MMASSKRRRVSLEEAPTSSLTQPTLRQPRRHITLYDVVAGRTNLDSLLPPFVAPHTSPAAADNETRDSHHSQARRYYRPAGPREVLRARRERVEKRTEEARARKGKGREGDGRRSRSRDQVTKETRPLATTTFAPEDVDETECARLRQLEEARDELPSSDLLKAIHRYTSLFYYALSQTEEERIPKRRFRSRARGKRHITHRFTPMSSDAHVSYRSLDETALIALGILVQEAAREAVGEEGWRALVEPGVWGPEEGDSEGEIEVDSESESESDGSDLEDTDLVMDSQDESEAGGVDAPESSEVERVSKRRKQELQREAAQEAETEEDLDAMVHIDPIWDARHMEHRI